MFSSLAYGAATVSPERELQTIRDAESRKQARQEQAEIERKRQQLEADRLKEEKAKAWRRQRGEESSSEEEEEEANDASNESGSSDDDDGVSFQKDSVSLIAQITLEGGHLGYYAKITHFRRNYPALLNSFYFYLRRQQKRKLRKELLGEQVQQVSLRKTNLMILIERKKEWKGL